MDPGYADGDIPSSARGTESPHHARPAVPAMMNEILDEMYGGGREAWGGLSRRPLFSHQIFIFHIEFGADPLTIQDASSI